MQHFISMMEQFVLTEVIEALWTKFKESLTNISVFEDLIRLHNDFLDKVMQKCYIDKKDNKVLALINQMFEFILKFNKVVKEKGPQVSSDQEAIEEIKKLETSFNKYSYFLNRF
mmetsp:Transcript_42979/g.31384  ORF Transcript_42979/g.31384 Transcript_42979/m.31384 type:complete len:114 (+) Transcript_42979:44-385(+)